MIAYVVICVCAIDSDELDDLWIKTKKYFYINLVILFLFAPLQILIPSSKLAATIYLLPKVVQDEKIESISNNALNVLNLKMESWIDEQLGTGQEK